MPKHEGSDSPKSTWKTIAWRLTTLAMGLAVLGELVFHYGWRQILQGLLIAGWGIVAVALLHVVSLVFDALAWRACYSAPRQLSLLRLLVDRWIGESVNNLLPSGQVAGDAVRARLAALRGPSPAESGAATIVDFTLNLLTQMLFALAGAALLIPHIGLSGWGGMIALAVVILAAVVCLLVAVQVFGQIGRFGKWTANLLAKYTSHQARKYSKATGELEEHLEHLYQDRRTLAIAGLFHIAAWLVEIAEIQLALFFLGQSSNYAQALVLHTITMAIRSVIFFIPGAVGAQEGAFILIGRLVGLTGETALALALIRRLRELLLGLPGLAAWWVRERNHRHERG